MNTNMNVNANVIVCLPYQPDFIMLGNRMRFLSECVFISGDALRTAVWGASFFILDGETDWRVRQITVLEEWWY